MYFAVHIQKTVGRLEINTDVYIFNKLLAFMHTHKKKCTQNEFCEILLFY